MGMGMGKNNYIFVDILFQLRLYYVVLYSELHYVLN